MLEILEAYCVLAWGPGFELESPDACSTSMPIWKNVTYFCKDNLT
jgi:hypothetical protein